jgi:hypothetical protein
MQIQIEFSTRLLALKQTIPSPILTAVTLPNHPTDILLLTREKNLLRMNIVSGKVERVSILAELNIHDDTQAQIKISPCLTYVAISLCSQEQATNSGIVCKLENGETVFELKDHEYHFELTDYPVAFCNINNQCYLIHASDWNTLDITNLITQECLTTRKDEEITEEQRESGLFTEWAGELKISPKGKRIATIGWAWHPVGIAWTFSLEDWIKDKWESDFGLTKKNLGDSYWSYFWHSPFAWLDDESVIIWGDPETQGNHDIPNNNVFICNAVTGEKIFSFDGPTMDIFEVDGDFLFSGNANQDGLSVWLWKTGAQIAEIPFKNRLLTYHQQQSTFITLNQDNRIELIAWKLNNDPDSANTL